MTNDTQPNQIDEKKSIPFGTRLKNAREALGLDRKEAAAQLRLSEKVILMMEKDRYPADLPITFIRGYIRAYGKLLQIPEYEIKKGVELIKPKQPLQTAPLKQFSAPVTSGNYFMQVFTYLILFTIIGLVGVWWYAHPGAVTSVTEAALTADNHPATQTTTKNLESAETHNNTTTTMNGPSPTTVVTTVENKTVQTSTVKENPPASNPVAKPTIAKTETPQVDDDVFENEVSDNE